MTSHKILLIVLLIFCFSLSNAMNKKSKINTSSPIDPVQLSTIASKLQLNLPSKNNQIKRISQLKQVYNNFNSNSRSQSGYSSIKETDEFTIYTDVFTKTPNFIKINKTKYSNAQFSTSTNLDNISVDFVKAHKALFNLDNPQSELIKKSQKIDKFRKKHVFFQQQYEHIPIWGQDLVFHYDENNQLYSINARYASTPKNINVNSVSVTYAQVIEIAKANLLTITSIQKLDDKLKDLLHYTEPTAEKYIWRDTNSYHFVWHVVIRPNMMDEYYYFVDANSGEILEKYNNTKNDGPTTASAVDLNGVLQSINTYLVGSNYYMIDASTPMWQMVQLDILNNPLGGLVTYDAENKDGSPFLDIISNNNTWSDPTAVSAHYNMNETFNYFYNNFGRNGIDDFGRTIISVIHRTENGASWGNAGWRNPFMLYGDGGTCFKPLAGALDVSAHEMTHGVVDFTCNLEYKYQSGALDESFADVFGAMVDREDWLIGEDVVLPLCYPSGALRNLEDPHNGFGNGWQPAHMDEYENLTLVDDHGGVHVNSGIPNHAAYLIGTSIGKDKLEQIYYRILDARYLNTQATFTDMRLAAILSASDLYGEQSAEVLAIETAFDAVGIYDAPVSTQPEDVFPLVGEEWIAVVNADAIDNSLYKIHPDIPATQIVQLTSTQVFNNTGKPLSVATDGSGIIFIDENNFIRTIQLDGTNEQVISASGDWSSLSLSPDGSKLAATSIYVDSSIYIFDFVNPDSSKVIQLYTPTTAVGGKLFNVLYADALDWNNSSEYVLYDAVSSFENTNGSITYTSSIFVSDVSLEQIYSLPITLDEGVNMGNPVFAKTNDIIIAFDHINSITNTNHIGAINLFNRAFNLIENNDSSYGYPSYSPDDKKMVFEREEFGVKTLRIIDIDDTKIAPVSTSTPWISEGSRPVWFVVNCCQGIRGNIDGSEDGILDIGDLVYLVDFMFRGGPAIPCFDEANVTGDPDILDIAELVYLVDYMFRGGTVPLDCLPY